MRTAVAGVSLGLLLAGGCGPSAGASSWALTNVSVVDVTNGRAEPDHIVLVEAGRISAVGPAATTSVPETLPVIDGDGRFVVPGLFDMHAHVLGASAERRGPALDRYVDAGVLGLRDLGSPLDAVAPLAAGRAPGSPSVWFAGPVLDVPRAGRPGVFRFVSDASDARQAVAELADGGARFVKVHDWLSRALYLSIAEAARAAGLPLVGHLPAAIEVEDAVAAGQQTIEHLGGTHGVLRACSTASETLRDEAIRLGSSLDKGPAYQRLMSDAYLTPLLDGFDAGRCAALAERLAAAGVAQVPTLVLWRAFVEAEGSPEDRAVRQRLFRTYLEIVGVMHRAGVSVLAGTDEVPGVTVVDELELLVEAGLSTADALRAATVGAADLLDASESHGVIAAGRRADFVLVDADPLVDIQNLRRIRTVVLGGVAR
jgi:imidazolonepropionase-like amidohydrolase